MPHKMLFTVIPAALEISHISIKHLLEAYSEGSPVHVRGVYDDTSQVPNDIRFHPRFEAVQGGLSDATTVDLGGAGSILVVFSPQSDKDGDLTSWMRDISENALLMIEKAGCIKRVVVLSCMGLLDTVSFNLFPANMSLIVNTRVECGYN